MRRLSIRTLLSVCAANFVAMNCFFAYLYTEDFRFHDSLLSAVENYLELAGTFFFFGVPISFLVAAAFGLPLYWGAKTVGCVNRWTSVFAGVVVALIPWSILAMLNWNLPSIGGVQGLLAFSVVGISGAVGGATFYGLEPARDNEKYLRENPTGDAGAGIAPRSGCGTRPAHRPPDHA